MTIRCITTVAISGRCSSARVSFPALRVNTHKFGLNLFAVARAEGFRP